MTTTAHDKNDNAIVKTTASISSEAFFMEEDTTASRSKEDHHRNESQTSTSSVPHNNGDTAADLSSFDAQQIRQSPVWQRNEPLCRRVLQDILPKWKAHHLPQSYHKIHKRWVKELNECEPFLTYCLDVAEQQQQTPFVIVDVCSGFGLFSMFLSELLPRNGSVQAIWLLDKSFPLRSVETGQGGGGGHHITVEHLDASSSSSSYEWPIPLYYRKVDIKKGREIRQLNQYRVFGDTTTTNVLLVGVHLCKALSVHLIQWYHRWSAAATSYYTPMGLLLKPCCLPGRRNLYQDKRPIVYKFANGYAFEPRSLYERQEEEDDDATAATDVAAEAICECGDAVDHGDLAAATPTKEQDADAASTATTTTTTTNGHTRTTNRRFTAWVEHLRQGCVSSTSRCNVATIAIQPRHFQNQFMFCEPIAAGINGEENDVTGGC